MTPVFDDDALRRVDVAILVALSLEATPLVEKLHDVVNLTAAAGLKITVGQLKERRVAVVTTGVGREAAVRGTQMTIAGHRPQLILAAGLCGGLAPDLRRGEVVIGQSVTRASGGSLTPIRTQGLLTTDGLRQVRVVTADSVVETPEGKRQLRAATDGDVVDMESWWIAEAIPPGQWFAASPTRLKTGFPKTWHTLHRSNIPPGSQERQPGCCSFGPLQSATSQNFANMPAPRRIASQQPWRSCSAAGE